MGNVGISADFVGREGKGFEGCVKVCDSILGKEADEVQSTDGEFAFRGGECGSADTWYERRVAAPRTG